MTQPLDRYFRSADALSRLAEHAARLIRLQAILSRELPPLMAESCGVANLKQDELVIHARSGAVAARLKQMLPSLLQAYARQGVLLAGIQVRVEVRNPTPAPPAVPRRDISAQTRGGLAQLANTLPADAPLAQALRRLVGRSGGKN
jgi:Dna[CI] antecedent DciA-like protein